MRLEGAQHAGQCPPPCVAMPGGITTATVAVATAGRKAAEDRERGRVESCGHGRTRLHGLAMTGHGPAHSC